MFFLLSGFCSLWVVDGPTPFIRVYRIEYRRLLRTQFVESCIGITFPQACEWYRRLLRRGPHCPWNSFLLWHHCHPCDIDCCEFFWCFSFSTIAPNHMLAVRFRALMRFSIYPGILIGLDDTNLTCIGTIAHAYDLTTTSAPPSRVFQTSLMSCPFVGIDS